MFWLILGKFCCILWCRGVAVITIAQLYSTKLHRFKSCSQRVGDLPLWKSLAMVPAGNKTKRLSSVNHTIKTILHHYHYHPLEMTEQICYFNWFISIPYHFGHVKACLTTLTWRNQLIFVGFMDLYSHQKIQLRISTYLWDILVKRILHSDWSRGFWTKAEKPDFSQAFCSWKKLKYHQHFHNKAKKHIYIYISEWIRFFSSPKNIFGFGTFWALQVHLNFFQKPGSVTFLILWCLSNCITRPNTTKNY